MTQQTKDRVELERQLIDIVAAETMVDISALTADTLLEDLDIQSADYVMILMAVEEKFGTYITVDSAFTDARTVGDLIAIVANKIGEGSGASA
jgi:acyl carrier protein